MNKSNSSIDSKALLLCMIGLSDNNKIQGELGGITRLQKLLFLLEKEANIKSDGDSFHFEPYKHGPYSSKLYDDLEFLENLGFLKSEEVGEAVEEESDEIDALNFDDFIDDGNKFADSFVERSFTITDEGKKKIENLLSKPEYEPFINGIRKIKSKYGNHSLSDLLYYVYKKYPEMTTESEIKDKVLGRRI